MTLDFDKELSHDFSQYINFSMKALLTLAVSFFAPITFWILCIQFFTFAEYAMQLVVRKRGIAVDQNKTFSYIVFKAFGYVLILLMVRAFEAMLTESSIKEYHVFRLVPLATPVVALSFLSYQFKLTVNLFSQFLGVNLLEGVVSVMDALYKNFRDKNKG